MCLNLVSETNVLPVCTHIPTLEVRHTDPSRFLWEQPKAESEITLATAEINCVLIARYRFDEARVALLLHENDFLCLRGWVLYHQAFREHANDDCSVGLSATFEAMVERVAQGTPAKIPVQRI